MSIDRLSRIEAILERIAQDREADRRETAELRSQITQAQETSQRETAELRLAVSELRSQIAQAQETSQRETAELRLAVSALLQTVELHQQKHELAERRLAQMQAASERKFAQIWEEIKGIRTENQRILEHLFGQQENGS